MPLVLHPDSCRSYLVVVLILSQRKSDSELAARAGRAINRDLATMRARNMLHQGKPQSASLGVVDERIADPIKLLKNFPLFARRYPDAVINDFQLHKPV